MGSNHNAKIWSKDYFILFVVSVASFLGFQMLNPNMAEFASKLGAGTGMLGTITSVFAFAALAARPFSGKAADQMDNKKLIIISLAGSTLSLFAYSFAKSVVLILVVRFIHGLFFGLNSTLSMTMASRTLPLEKTGAGMGIFGLGSIATMTVAPTIGIYIAQNIGYDWLFYISAFFSLIATVLLFFIKPQRAERKEDGGKQPIWKTFFAPEASGPSAIAMFTSFAFASINTFLLIHAEDRGVANIGLYYTVNALALLAFRPLISKYLDKVPMRVIIYPCCISMIGALVLISIARSLPVFLIAAVLFGFGNGGVQPALQTLCLKCVGFERRGAASGTFYIGMDIGNIIGPVSASLVAAQFGYGSAFLAMAVPVLLGMGVMFIYDRGEKAKAQRITIEN